MRSDLTASDWCVVAIALLPVAFLLLFPAVVAPEFERMFRDFAIDALPALTLLVLDTRFAPAVAVVPLALLAAALFMRRLRIGRARFLIVLALANGLVAAATCIVALYLPSYH